MIFIQDFKSYFGGRFLAQNGGITKALDSRQQKAVGISLDALTGPAAERGFISASALREEIPGIIRDLSKPLRMDKITGVTTAGSWETNELRIKGEQATGQAERYTDHGNIPLVGVSPIEEIREVVRFEQGLEVGLLEAAQAGMDNRDMLAAKRVAQEESLNRTREEIAIFGLANTRTYGLLNDPNLAPVAANNDAWIGATFDELVAEFTSMVAALSTQIGYFDKDWSLLLLLPDDALGGYRAAMNTVQVASAKMFSVWLKESYPNLRWEFLPELEGANAAVDMAYLIVESEPENERTSVQGGTLTQIIPAKYHILGHSQEIKKYVEAASMATAGTVVLKPWNVTRRDLA